MNSFRQESNIVNVNKPNRKTISRKISKFQWLISVIFDYLNQPTNGIHRAGAIAVGALSGYIIAIRRGFFKRLLYSSIGGLGVASICYPKEAEKYAHEALSEAKTYATIFYNFAYGGKKISFHIVWETM